TFYSIGVDAGMWPTWSHGPSQVAIAIRAPQAEITSWNPSSDHINDIEITSEGSVRLSQSGYARQDQLKQGTISEDPHGYLQVPNQFPANIFSCVSIQARTSALNFSYRLDHEFNVILGDGDLKAIGLKVDGKYKVPDQDSDPRVDSAGRWYLDRELPIDQKFTACLSVYAPPEAFEKKVKAEVQVFDVNGKKLDMGPLPTWTIRGGGSQNNGSHTISLGVLDSLRNFPEFEIKGLCTIEMKDIGSQPSQREQDACISP
ncbi:MAG: hypothetical protein AAB424_04180, partial [Patescibacteria group bacterium]